MHLEVHSELVLVRILHTADLAVILLAHVVLGHHVTFELRLAGHAVSAKIANVWKVLLLVDPFLVVTSNADG